MNTLQIPILKEEGDEAKQNTFTSSMPPKEVMVSWRNQLIDDIEFYITGEVISKSDLQLILEETDYDYLRRSKDEAAKIIVFLLGRIEAEDDIRREAYAMLRTSVIARKYSNPVDRISGMFAKAYRKMAAP
jgi:hypothetical protein